MIFWPTLILRHIQTSSYILRYHCYIFILLYLLSNLSLHFLLYLLYLLTLLYLQFIFWLKIEMILKILHITSMVLFFYLRSFGEYCKMTSNNWGMKLRWQWYDKYLNWSFEYDFYNCLFSDHEMRWLQNYLIAMLWDRLRVDCLRINFVHLIVI